MKRKPGKYDMLRLRESVFRRDGNKCVYCHKWFLDNALTLDHKIPKSKGGTYKIDNLLTCCEPCNMDKADKSYSEYTKYLKVCAEATKRLNASVEDLRVKSFWERIASTAEILRSSGRKIHAVWTKR